jgi:hypothetical protein
MCQKVRCCSWWVSTPTPTTNSTIVTVVSFILRYDYLRARQTCEPTLCTTRFNIQSSTFWLPSVLICSVSQQNWLQQWVRQLVLKSINLLILYGIRKSDLRSGRNRSLYLFIKRTRKQTVVIIEAIASVNCIQNLIQHPAVKVFSTGRGY